MHFLVQSTIECICLGGLPTLVFLATPNHGVGRLILSKVQAFSGMYFTSHCDREVFVGNHAVAVSVELLKKVLELFISYMHAPVV